MSTLIIHDTPRIPSKLNRLKRRNAVAFNQNILCSIEKEGLQPHPLSGYLRQTISKESKFKESKNLTKIQDLNDDEF